MSGELAISLMNWVCSSQNFIIGTSYPEEWEMRCINRRLSRHTGRRRFTHSETGLHNCLAGMFSSVSVLEGLRVEYQYGKCC
jgi:hypothetical protein